MKNDRTDEKFDQLMRRLMTEASLDDESVNEIADSPAMWWGVQRRIADEKTARSPWPPVNSWLRWLAIGVPALAALTIAMGALMYWPLTSDSDVVATAPSVVTEPQPTSVRSEPTAQPLPSAANDHSTARSVIKAKFIQPKRAAAKSGLTAALPKQPQEIKTDFIALSYARDPESGQIVRVKVPSSMMVSTGLVASVKKPSELVDAEVIIGDDGLTRAIRFIHKQ